MTKPLVIAGRAFTSRLFIGTGKFGSHDLMRQAVQASGCELVTVALRRVDLDKNPRSEERRVGKECRSRVSPYH
mgnify:CR=1 FL=1